MESPENNELVNSAAESAGSAGTTDTEDDIHAAEIPDDDDVSVGGESTDRENMPAWITGGHYPRQVRRPRVPCTPSIAGNRRRGQM